MVREALTLSSYATVSFARLSETGSDSRDLPSNDRIGDRARLCTSRRLSDRPPASLVR
jgi:hypothetical protein